jgi:hypothetical protein
MQSWLSAQMRSLITIRAVGREATGDEGCGQLGRGANQYFFRLLAMGAIRRGEMNRRRQSGVTND